MFGEMGVRVAILPPLFFIHDSGNGTGSGQSRDSGGGALHYCLHKKGSGLWHTLRSGYGRWAERLTRLTIHILPLFKSLSGLVIFHPQPFWCSRPYVEDSEGGTFFFTLVTGPRRSLSLKLSDTKVYEPQIRARLGNHNTTILGVCERGYRAPVGLEAAWLLQRPVLRHAPAPTDPR